MKNIDEYADFTDSVWKEPVESGLDEVILMFGLAGEVGEVIEMAKKRLHYGTAFAPDRVKKELGDILFYWVRLCRSCTFEPSEVIQANIDKLSKRKVDDTLWGEGSDR